MAYSKTDSIESQLRECKERLEALNQLIEELEQKFVDGKISIAADSVKHLSGLQVNQLADISHQGQTLSEIDLLMVHDVSKDRTRKVSLGKLYDQYLCTKEPSPAGSMGELQMKGGSGFVSTADIRHVPAKRTLYVKGSTEIHHLRVTGQLAAPVKHVRAAEYEVQEGDHTLLMDISDEAVTVLLPNAADNTGRIIHIKVKHANKYALKTHSVTVKSTAGLVDYFDEIVIKMARSSRTLQSDGEHWWVINSRGS